MSDKYNQLLLSLDIGTSGGRSIVFNTQGKILASAYEEYPSLYPSPAHVEQNAEDWWRVTKNTVREVLRNKYVNPSFEEYGPIVPSAS